MIIMPAHRRKRQEDCVFLKLLSEGRAFNSLERLVFKRKKPSMMTKNPRGGGRGIILGHIVSARPTQTIHEILLQKTKPVGAGKMA
jgi:hypothetical protein